MATDMVIGRIEFSPGPWRVRDGSAGVVGRNKVGAFEVIAHVAQRSQIEANARLIAAAPELLAALKDIVCEVRDNNPSKLAALAAIAKAEGK